MREKIMSCLTIRRIFEILQLEYNLGVPDFPFFQAHETVFNHMILLAPPSPTEILSNRCFAKIFSLPWIKRRLPSSLAIELFANKDPSSLLWWNGVLISVACSRATENYIILLIPFKRSREKIKKKRTEIGTRTGLLDYKTISTLWPPAYVLIRVSS